MPDQAPTLIRIEKLPPDRSRFSPFPEMEPDRADSVWKGKNMNYAEIKSTDIANGPGVRVSLFVSGCTHHCKGCFNPETWDFSYGQPFDEAVEERIFRDLDHPFIEGLSLLGGEPFEPENSRVLAGFVRKVKDHFPDKTIWCYSGYRLDEEILTDRMGGGRYTEELLSCLDVLVDGEFVEELKVLTLKFRGSSNQRLIDVPASLKSGTIVQWEDPAEKVYPGVGGRMKNMG